MGETTKSREKYIAEWNNYIESLYLLCMTKDTKLSDKIRHNIEQLEECVVKVADTKDLH